METAILLRSSAEGNNIRYEDGVRYLVAGEKIRPREARQHAEIAPRHRMALEAAHRACSFGDPVGFGRT